MARTKKSERQTVRVPVHNQYGSEIRIGGYDLEGTVDEAIARLTQLKTDFPDKVLKLDWRQERYDDSYALHVEEERPETDEEMAERKEKDRKHQEAREASERAQFERLRKQFEGK